MYAGGRTKYPLGDFSYRSNMLRIPGENGAAPKSPCFVCTATSADSIVFCYLLHVVLLVIFGTFSYLLLKKSSSTKTFCPGFSPVLYALVPPLPAGCCIVGHFSCFDFLQLPEHTPEDWKHPATKTNTKIQRQRHKQRHGTHT